MFYTYEQNNSGGYFDYDEEKGISVYVIVEADNAKDANQRAENIGLYFYGGADCQCCGSRWSDAWESEVYTKGTEEPDVNGVNPIRNPSLHEHFFCTVGCAG